MNDIPYIQPATIKACSRCRTKRIKCDMSLPSCSGCLKRGASCDITDMASYSFQSFRALQEENDRLKESMRSAEVLSGADPPKRRKHEVHRQDTEIDKIVTEVGSLNNNSSGTYSSYLGSATGTTLLQIFLNQVDVSTLHGLKSLDLNNGNLNAFHESSFANAVYATLPNHTIIDYLWISYIDEVHVLYPIIDISRVRKIISDLKNRSMASFGPGERYVLFMVFAIASYCSQNKKTYQQLKDDNLPREYFASAFKYLEATGSGSQEELIESLEMLTLWSLISNDSTGNLWKLTRHVVTLCIELGCHRYNPNWDIGESTTERRNRLWWCAFMFERQVAVQTGRVLSIRSQAIDAELPKFSDRDALTAEESRKSTVYKHINFQPLYLLTKLRSIGGDILESIYIARGKGRPTLAIEVVKNTATHLREELDIWLESVMDLYEARYERLFLELRVHYVMYSLLLSQPSPSFPRIAESAAQVCLTDAKAGIESFWGLVEKHDGAGFWGCAHMVSSFAVCLLYSAWVVRIAPEEITVYVHRAIRLLRVLSTQRVEAQCRVLELLCAITTRYLASEHENIPQASVGCGMDLGSEDTERQEFVERYIQSLTHETPFKLLRDLRTSATFLEAGGLTDGYIDDLLRLVSENETIYP
ncbi:hypothetical protein KL949_004552 [Ogataea haglerorum]|uniref:Zn(2)-C6 fungal-type domain-containing protein n=3 Tax=Ogataea haglerorum TaxID=1937702 RepID=A0ABQ7RAX5_9ASCO|nr:hypothetical protein KL949_004552 [Ogataea haglerorum]KAG7715006.1 hypothetical protein KL913_004327 [Ogataea haglerorum]KAG7735320.1 hypothetical protein KL932_004527 [Ogataea haglerorum]KAG7749800.1 hypothetical protein KL912_001801 [Ogataea haglerorum]KAG7762369.1 hypothetical protein KL946_004765 [Ogataea haglerorum]